VKRKLKNNVPITGPLLGIIMALTSCNPGTFHHRINQYDSQGRRQGKWISYWDEAKKIPMNIENYKNGRENGYCRYYYMDGTKRLQFKAFKNGHMKVKYYTETGLLEKKGPAVMIYNPQEIRYSWNGIWKFYENRQLIRKTEYYMGEEIP